MKFDKIKSPTHREGRGVGESLIIGTDCDRAHLDRRYAGNGEDWKYFYYCALKSKHWEMMVLYSEDGFNFEVVEDPYEEGSNKPPVGKSGPFPIGTKLTLDDIKTLVLV